MRWRTFGEARTLARQLGLPTKDAWVAWAHSPARPPDVPVRPDNAYRRQGWVSWYDWLGKSRPSRRPFPAARAYAQSLHLSSVAAWRAWSQSGARPTDIPSNPHLAYQDAGWQDWGDWLGTARRHVSAQRRPFAAARAFARSLGLHSGRAWAAWARTSTRPHDIPALPQQVYRHQGWAGWSDWLGPSYGSTGRGAHARPFAAARSYARALGLRSSAEWYRWAATSARPGDIPAHPARTYQGQGWAGFPDWLGTGPPATRRHRR